MTYDPDLLDSEILAERNGQWIDGDGVRHGTANAYAYHKCRCETCTRRHRDDMRRWRERRRSRVA